MIRGISTAQYPFAGVGHAMTFICGGCAKSRSVTGRKLRHVRGFRTWVCAECAAPKEVPAK